MTAAEARQKANYYRNCPEVLQKIDKAVKDGMTFCEIKGHIEDYEKEFLQQQGYRVELDSLPNTTRIYY